jgi:hypothetical protein
MAYTIIEAGDEFPPVCLRCGARADTLVTRQYSSRQESGSGAAGGLLVSLAIGLLFLPLGFLVIFRPGGVTRTRTITLRLPFCPAHENHWFYRQLTGWFTLLAMMGLATVVSIFAMKTGRAGLAGLALAAALGVSGVVATILYFTSIRCTEMGGGRVTLVGVAEEFDDQLLELRKLREQEFQQQVVSEWVDPPLPRPQGPEGGEDNPFANLDS